MRKTLLTAAALVAFALTLDSPGPAQEPERSRPDHWRGMVLDETTPEAAIASLGKPAKDSVQSLHTDGVNQWITKRRKEKIFRTLEYKRPSEGVEKAWLAFLDGKLVSINLDLKEGTVSPNGLSSIYGLEFTPIIGQADLALSPRDFERTQGKVYPKTYPTIYHLAATSDRSLVVAMVGNVPSFFGALAKGAGVEDKPGSFPGKTMFVQLISRTLENRDGADVLK